MTTAIVVGIVTPLLGFAIWYWRRKLERTETREEILERYEAEARKVLSKTGGDVNALLDDRLRRINRNPSRPGGDVVGPRTEGTPEWLPRAPGEDAGDSGRAGKT